MKKTLAAVAVLGAFAGSTLAADVQLYGIVDTGLAYVHGDADGLGEDFDSFSMESGQGSGSRWGIKGTEDLGNGLTVGFILEDGFNSDDGSESGVMFNRESSLFIQGGFGKLAFGRMGALNNGQSSWSKIGMINAFGTSYGEYTARVERVLTTAAQWDNMIAYETPDFAGFKVYAQYGMGNAVDDYDSEENESSSDRFYAIGATYNNGPFAAYLAVDSINYASWSHDADGLGNDGGSKDVDDSLTVTLGGSYDFEVVKLYLGAQYFDEMKLSTLGGIMADVDVAWNGEKIKGYGITFSGDAPLWGDKALFGLGYVDAESADSFEDTNNGASFDFKRYVVSVGYDYPFSKRTDVYAVASYMQDQWETTTAQGATGRDADPSAYSVIVGLRHRF
ncbi:porin [Sutterella sp. AM11-39]|uniref:porin n=1 Tax=Sutterella sp. AM11-39 TaxID=2292075 RepID=UPI000E523CDE|nr:porin [Sutterella sp. AM11-39]RHJ32591.1 porin [Sutterella sp. AM11-39]